MVLYNVTVSVDSEVESEWLTWMKSEHIPEVMDTGFFVSHRIMKMLNDQPDATGPTYAIQYELETMGHLDQYLKVEAPGLQQKHMMRFGQRCIAFRSVLEEV